jgi:4-carboxymuconolactone decarboxylase
MKRSGRAEKCSKRIAQASWRGKLNWPILSPRLTLKLHNIAKWKDFPMRMDRRTVMTGAAALPLSADPVAAQMPPAEDRYQRGLAQLEMVSGPQGVAVVQSLNDIAPDLGRYIVEFAYGDIFARPGLDVKTREIATVAALTAMGTAQPQLKVHLQAALRVGATQKELVETIMQMIPYAGFPAALNAVAVARDVFADE